MKLGLLSGLAAFALILVACGPASAGISGPTTTAAQSGQPGPQIATKDTVLDLETGSIPTPTVAPPAAVPVPTAIPDPDYTPSSEPRRPQPLPAVTPAERKAAGASRLYLAAFQNDFISVVDPISGHALHQIPVKADQAGMAVSPDGARLYVVDGVTAPEGRVRVFDTATWQLIHREPAPERSRLRGANPIALSPDGRWLVVGFYSYERGERWTRVFDTQRLKFIEDGWKLSDCRLAPLRLYGQANDTRAYVQCQGFVAVLKAEDLSPVRQIPSPTPFEGGDPRRPQVGGPDLAVSPDGKRLYGLYPRIERRAEGSNLNVVGTDLRLLVWDTDEGEQVQDVMMSKQASVPLATGGRGDAGYLAVSSDGAQVFVAWERMLWALDGRSLQVKRELRLPSPVDGIALGVDGRELYLLPSTFGNLSPRERGLFTVDTATLELTRHADDWPRLTAPFIFTAPAPGMSGAANPAP